MCMLGKIQVCMLFVVIRALAYKTIGYSSLDATYMFLFVDYLPLCSSTCQSLLSFLASLALLPLPHYFLYICWVYLYHSSYCAFEFMLIAVANLLFF